jgi:hypothetical protein
LIEGHLRDLQMVMPKNGRFKTARADCAQILLLDSCTSARAYEEALRCIGAAPDLVIFDTACFSGGSSRIRRVLTWARRDVPIVLVRSHAKLDSLGAEYGRLGSADFFQPATGLPWAAGSTLQNLPSETKNAIRLFGGAALPAHFPPLYRNRCLPVIDEPTAGGDPAKQPPRLSLF